MCYILYNIVIVFKYMNATLLAKKAKVNYLENKGTNPIEVYRKRHKEKIACLVS